MKKKILVFVILLLSIIAPLYNTNASENYGNKDALQYLTRPSIINSTLSDREFTKFEDTINKALDLLQEYDPDAYIRVCLNVNQVGYRQDTPETPNALAVTTFDNVFLTGLLLKQSDKYVPWSVAGILSHESIHAAMHRYYLYLTIFAPFASNSNRIEYINQEEILAYQCAINTFEKLNVPDLVINAQRTLQQQYKNKLKN